MRKDLNLKGLGGYGPAWPWPWRDAQEGGDGGGGAF